jgi:ATP-binding cassette subfamily F protein uup
MDKLVDHLFIFEGDGVIRDYPGNYTQFRILEKSKQNYASVSSDISSAKEHTVPAIEKKVEPIPATIEKKVVEKMTYKEKLELETLNKEMPILEEKKAAFTEKLNNTNLNYEEIIAISEKLSEVNAALDLAEVRWLELSEKQ